MHCETITYIRLESSESDKHCEENVAKFMHRGDFKFHKSTIWWISSRISRLSYVKDIELKDYAHESQLLY